jgi:hypothetical protein
MKHIKTFESHSTELINEELDVKKLLKEILIFPLVPLFLVITNLMNPRTLLKGHLPIFFDIYQNSDVLIDTLENIYFNGDVTDVEKKKVMKRINALKKIKNKYPTLEIYKQKSLKTLKILNIRNKSYIEEEVMKYQPKQMRASEVLKEIQKVYKLVKSEQIVGDVKSEPTWEEQLRRGRII